MQLEDSKEEQNLTVLSFAVLLKQLNHDETARGSKNNERQCSSFTAVLMMLKEHSLSLSTTIYLSVQQLIKSSC